VARLGSDILRALDFFAADFLDPREVLRAGDLREVDLREADLREAAFREDDFFAIGRRLDERLRVLDARLRVDFPALEPRLLPPRELREEAFRAEDLRALERVPPFLAPLEPPRDDFLAAAISELR
jgi:hypothetical protein